MANSTIDYSALQKYTDQLSTEILREAVLQGNTFQYISILRDVAHTKSINYMTSNLIAQAGGCGLISPTGSVALAQRDLTVCKFKVEEGICPDDEKDYWLGMKMPNGSYIEDLEPKEFAEVYTADKMAKLSALVEDYYWKGSVSGTYSSNLTLCNGLLYILDSTSATSSLTLATYSGALTPTTAVTVIDAMIQQMNVNIPDILTEPDLTVFLNYADFNALATNLRNLNYFHNGIGQIDHEWTFMYPGQNVRIVATRGLNGTNKILLTPAKNLYAGFDSFQDESKFTIWYERLYDTVFFRSKWKQASQIAYPKYCVYKAS